MLTLTYKSQLNHPKFDTEGIQELVRNISIDRYRVTEEGGKDQFAARLEVSRRRDGVRAPTNLPLPLHGMWLKENLADETVKSVKWDFQCPGSADM